MGAGRDKVVELNPTCRPRPNSIGKSECDQGGISHHRGRDELSVGCAGITGGPLEKIKSGVCLTLHATISSNGSESQMFKIKYFL